VAIVKMSQSHDSERSEIKNDCAGEGQQQFTRPTGRLVNYEMESIWKETVVVCYGKFHM
jgi:hypothetical protein